jgi:hypothetical protein
VIESRDGGDPLGRALGHRVEKSHRIEAARDREQQRPIGRECRIARPIDDVALLV